MKKILFLLFILFMFNTILFSQNWEWVRHGGGTSADGGNDMYMDANGNIYILGGFNGTATFSGQTITTNGYSDIYISKYDNRGNLKWVRSGGGADCDGTGSIYGDGDGNIYISANIGYGGSTDTIKFDSLFVLANGSDCTVIAKYDSLGSIKWLKKGGEAWSIYDFSIRVNHNNSIYSFGEFIDQGLFDSTTLYSPNNFDMYIVKYKTDGEFQWIKQLGGLYDDYMQAAVIDSDNNIFILGAFQNEITLDTITLHGHSIYNDLFIAKLDSNANVIWAKSMGSNGEDEPYNMALDQNEDILINGFFSDTISFDTHQLISKGSYDVFLAKYSKLGNNIWAIQDGGQGTEFTKGLTVGTDNSIYISGSFSDSTKFNNVLYLSNGETDMYIAKYSSNGAFQWFKKNGGSSLDEANELIAQNQKLFITGWMSDTVLFDTISMASTGGRDLFFGEILDSTTVGICTYQNNEIIRIYPNPSTNSITINIPEKASIEIINIEGQILKSLTANNNSTTIDVSAFARGMYFVKVKTEKGVAVKKFVKE